MGASNTEQFDKIWNKPMPVLIEGHTYLIKLFDGAGVCKSTRFNQSADQVRAAYQRRDFTAFAYDENEN